MANSILYRNLEERLSSPVLLLDLSDEGENIDLNSRQCAMLERLRAPGKEPH